MDVVFRFKGSEFNEQVKEQIEFLLKKRQNAEVTIAITDIPSTGVLRNEGKDDYFARLDAAINRLNNGAGKIFTPKEFAAFSQQFLNEP